MSKNDKQKKKDAIVSFRTADEIKRQIDREAKRRKQTRSDFVAAVFMSGFELATGNLSR